MRNLLNPKWIFLINTLPVAILFFIFYSEFNIIKSLLEPESIDLWKTFGVALVTLGLLNMAYAIYQILNKKNVSIFYGIAALMCHIPFIYLYGLNTEDIIPFTIPEWMIPGEMIIYVGTFLMPTLIYSLFVLVSHFTSEAKNMKAWKSFLIAIIVPITWYVFSQIIIPLRTIISDNFSVHVILIFVIIGTLIFLFFIIRGLLILATKKAAVWKKYQLAWKIPIAIVLPLLGLAVNNGHLFNDFRINNTGVFGDFDGYWFYGLAAINGLLICLPNLENKIYRLLLFIGRSITFAYTVYFFVVFLPFLPISVVAIVGAGVGFLLLAPLLLFVIHVNELSNDFQFLRKYFAPTHIWIYSVIAFLVIPSFITADYLSDKRTLNETLEYVYTPDYSKNYDIDEISLQKTLNIVSGHKDKNRGGIFGSQQPYLSSYFNWLVLDNLTLSDSKINTIERIFFGETSFHLGRENIQNENIDITDIATSSTYDESQNAWISWIDLEITNNRENSWLAEYATTIELPTGTWISDYYLYVGDRKEMGILAEKKSAMWVFSNIRNENKDPGILYYLTGNKVAFRVFPFAQDEVRRTGIELIHKEPIQLNFDGNLLNLGDSGKTQETIIKHENVDYISAAEKEKLKKVNRKPYFHFVLDASDDADSNAYNYRIKELTNNHEELTENAKVSFVGSYVTTTLLDSVRQEMENPDCQGGFYIDRAIKSILYESYEDHSNSYPIIVVVTDNFHDAVFDKDFSDWQFSFPESDLFYILNENGSLDSHSLTSAPTKTVKNDTQLSLGHSVLAYNIQDNTTCYLPDDNQASIVLKNEQFQMNNTEILEKDWNSALTMQASWNAQILNPHLGQTEWLNLVKSSFLSKVMTPVTSYLVVENEAQKAILKKKQEQILSSNMSLDPGEDVSRMSEPNIIILAVLLGLLLWIRRRRQLVVN